MKLFFVLLLFATAALAAPKVDPEIFSEKLSPKLLDALNKINSDQEDFYNVFIEYTGGATSVLDYISSTRFPSREDRLNTMHDMLLELASKTQEKEIEYLRSHAYITFYQSFWINNQVYARNLSITDITNILFGNFNVASIEEENEAYLPEPESHGEVVLSQAEYQWGIEKIQAPDAWEVIGNNDGRGIRIATVDTGVRVTHEALRYNYLGDYGWWDPSTKEPLPTDRNGHGTHTTGTIAGRNGIGVAPGAQWMACRGCASSACSQFDLVSCGEFFACPTLADGTNPDCSKAPHVVSNSWGGGRGSTCSPNAQRFNGVIDAWVAGGIVPVFSIGNSGPRCDTANSPGDNRNVIGVGSTTSEDAISSFSSVGPTHDGRMKPDISAPGSDVISAYHLADDAYRSLSGTSMACPHVAGTVALLLTGHTNATFENVKELLFENTDKDLSFSGQVCEDIGDDKFPNHNFGSGRLNALKSVIAQAKRMH